MPDYSTTDSQCTITPQIYLAKPPVTTAHKTIIIPFLVSYNHSHHKFYDITTGEVTYPQKSYPKESEGRPVGAGVYREMFGVDVVLQGRPASAGVYLEGGGS